MASKKTIIIDGNNIAFGIWSQFANGKQGFLTNSVGLNTTLIFGILRTLAALAEKFDADNTLLCWDVKGSKYRKELWPEYKQARKDSKPPFDMTEYFENLDQTREVLASMGIKQPTAEYVEADDLIGYLAARFAKLGKVVIVSNDKDYYQVLSSRIKLYRPIKEEIVTAEDVIEKYGLDKASTYAKLLALIGDKDEVPGIYRLGEKGAAKLLEEFNWSLKRVVRKCDKTFLLGGGSPDKNRYTLAEISPSRFVAYKLARIRTKISQYQDYEKEVVRAALAMAMKKTKVKMKEINKITSLFDIESINVAHILRRLGVEVVGKERKAGGFTV